MIMRPTLVTEVVEKKNSALIVDKSIKSFGELIKKKLEEFDIEVFVSTAYLKEHNDFDYFFFIDEEPSKDLIHKNFSKKFVYILRHKKNSAQNFAKWCYAAGPKNIKVVNIPEDLNKDAVDKLLWFCLSKSKENYLNLEFLPPKKDESGQFFSGFAKLWTGRSIIKTIFLLIIGIYLSVFPLIAVSSFLFYRAEIEFKKEKIKASKNILRIAGNFYNISKNIYQLVRPSFLFFSIALVPDNLMTLNEKSGTVLERSISVYENGTQLAHLLLKRNKTPDEKSIFLTRLGIIQEQSKKLEDDLLTLSQKIPEYTQKTKQIKSEVQATAELIKKTNQAFPLLKEVLTENTERRYLLLFANNMELRPGGGFIGSYGILTMKDMTLERIDVYDVYDADGQLAIHVDPPKAIRQFLNQPNWFLRDSAFSPDFYENYNQAKFFLVEELGLTGFSGSMLITTTAIQNVLEAFGDINLADYDEIVNKENFYLKAQLYSEDKYFPGSIQKKTFLGSLSRQLFINFDVASFPKLMLALEKMLDEKQIVLALEDDKMQKRVDSLYWSGKIIVPQCNSGSLPCISDYLLPLDANLGVNKANFYVSKNITLKIRVRGDGTLNNSLLVNFKNDSLSSTFPGGSYKNYFQLYLSKNSLVKSVTKNDVLIDKIFIADENISKSLGFLVEIPPQSQSEIRIDYQIDQKIEDGKQIYQLVFQKQIGSKNSDLNLEISLPSNIHLTNQNFSPLVKENRILYNTSLSADKIFILEFTKE